MNSPFLSIRKIFLIFNIQQISILFFFNHEEPQLEIPFRKVIMQESNVSNDIISQKDSSL